ncbi:MAG: DUF5606 domain-containing protein [Bacteroidota bacterium]
MLKDILSISGQGGLFKYISQGRNGIIVESLVDNKRIFVPATAKISSLEDIAVFTEGEEVPLEIVLKKIKEKQEEKPAPGPKSSNNELKSFFEEVLPEYDKDRVYVSDIKKIVNWYNILLELNLLNFEEEKKEEQVEEQVEEKKEEQVEEQVENEVEEKKVEKTGKTPKAHEKSPTQEKK